MPGIEGGGDVAANQATSGGAVVGTVCLDTGATVSDLKESSLHIVSRKRYEHLYNLCKGRRCSSTNITTRQAVTITNRVDTISFSPQHSPPPRRESFWEPHPRHIGEQYVTVALARGRTALIGR
jgi:hypothetical protein